MTDKPIVSIIGRPNVGKSSLFNRILRKKIAVVDDQPGVTRDRNYMNATWNDLDFVLVDTGGMVPLTQESIGASINRQVEIAIAESAVVVLLTEIGTGPTDLDLQIARRLRKDFKDKVILAVNKAEKKSMEPLAAEFVKLGLGEPLPLSALHGNGVGDLLDAICKRVRAVGWHGKTVHAEELRLAVIGRPNVGKSSFVNALLREERMIVDNVAGTTRDAVDSTLTLEGRAVRLIDTAGLRRKGQVKQDLEYYTNVHALGSIERCDVCVLMCDVDDGVREQDLKIMRQINEQHKGLVVVLNKWDLVTKDGKTFDHIVKELRLRSMELRHVPMVSISAKTGQRVTTVVELAAQVKQRLTHRVPTAQFKDALFEWVRLNPHPISANKQVRILGGKQRHAAYPLFEIFCVNHEAVVSSYQRYLTNKIYELDNFDGCPVGLVFKPAAPRRRTIRKAGPADDDHEED